MGEWREIETAPRDGTVIDVWLVGPLSDIEFYCCQSPLKVNGKRATYQGRAAGWMWLGGKFRPFLKGLNMPVFVEPTHWQPLPAPPSSRPRGAGV